MESGAVARAGAPPVVGGVDQGIPARLAVIGVDEILDPGYHGRLAQAVAGRTARVVLDVQHARKSPPVPAPASAVREEEIRLGAAGAGVGVREVVSATDEASVGGTGVVVREAGVDISGALRGLHADVSVVSTIDVF